MRSPIKYILGACIGLLTTVNGFSQQSKIDSLTAALNEGHPDSVQVNVLIQLSNIHRFTDPVLAGDYSLQALKLHTDSISTKGKKKKAKIIDNIGIAKAINGKYQESVQYFITSLNIREVLQDQEGIGTSYNNIGNVYKAMERIDEALDYYLRAYDIFKALNQDREISLALNNAATIYGAKGEFEKAIELYREAERLKIKAKDTFGLIYSYNNYSVLYEKMGLLDSALYYSKKVEKLVAKDENYDNVLSNYAIQGRIYEKLNRFDEAERMYQKCIREAKERNYPQRLMLAYQYISLMYASRGQYEKAYTYEQYHSGLKDSLHNIRYEKEIADINVKYDTAKKQQQILLQEEQLKKERVIRYGIALGAVLLVLLLVLIYMRYKVKSKLSSELQQMNHIIAQKNEDITASIVYAKRIQGAILPSDKIIKTYLPDSFIFYRPKDIVAGDFYWLEPKDDKILFAACDCTGHGVPGAMVSVICNNGLNRSVREHGLTDPGKILDKTREIVIKEFEKSEEEVKDGMDVALCTLQGTTLSYAGANNPLWIIRKQGDEIEEIKANKQAIGKTEHSVPFTAHTIEMNPGDLVYIFSDGFVDQFGGQNDKKFKSANFKKLLLSIKDLPMKDQHLRIEAAFENWKGDREQLDDVCVIGVRI